MDNQEAMRLHLSIMELLATFEGKNVYDKIITMSQTERQWSVNRASMER